MLQSWGSHPSHVWPVRLFEVIYGAAQAMTADGWRAFEEQLATRCLVSPVALPRLPEGLLMSRVLGRAQGGRGLLWPCQDVRQDEQ